jgi:hypothetical protein
MGDNGQSVTLDFTKAIPLQNAQAQGAPQAQQPAVNLDFSKAQPTVITMVGPNGETQQVAPENVAVMRRQNFSVDPSTPGARPMIAPTSREGTKFYAAPQEVDDLVKAGNRALPTDAEAKILADDAQKGQAQQGWLSKTLAMRPDAQSPEAQAIRDKIQNWQAMELANSPMFREQIKDKAVGGAVVASAPAAAFTAGALAPTATGVLTAGGEEIMGPSLARQGMQWLGSQLPNAPGWLKGAGTLGAGAGIEEGGRWLYNKLKH